MKAIPNVGDLVAIVVDGVQQSCFRVSRRTRTGQQVFLWDNETPHKLEDCISNVEAEILWANDAIADCPDECAVELVSIFAQAYAGEWRKTIWDGLTPENQAKLRHLKAIAQGEEVAA